MFGLKTENTRGSGRTTKCMEKERFSGMTAENTTDSTRMTRSTVLAPSNGLISVSILVSGLTGSNTAEDSTFRRRAKRRWANGSKAKELNGWMSPIECYLV